MWVEDMSGPERIRRGARSLMDLEKKRRKRMISKLTGHAPVWCVAGPSSIHGIGVGIQAAHTVYSLTVTIHYFHKTNKLLQQPLNHASDAIFLLKPSISAVCLPPICNLLGTVVERRTPAWFWT